jgi:hypothetical protein
VPTLSLSQESFGDRRQPGGSRSPVKIFGLKAFPVRFFGLGRQVLRTEALSPDQAQIWYKFLYRGTHPSPKKSFSASVNSAFEQSSVFGTNSATN